MQIAINAIPLLSRLTGVGNGIYHTARALLEADQKNHYSFYYGYFADRLICPADSDHGTSDPRFGLFHGAKMLTDHSPTLRSVVRKVERAYHRIATSTRTFDVYYEPNYIPLDINCDKLVTTVHDLSFICHPEWHPKDRIEAFSKHFLRQLARSDIITADSDFTRQELLRILKIDKERIRVVHLGYDKKVFRPRPLEEIERFRRARQLPERFVLLVGSIEPRKNINGLLAALAYLPEKIRKGLNLVFVGSSGWRNGSTMRVIDEMKEEVSFLGYLDAEELALVYNAATVFAYPSLYEGFGLPPLEAMACGCPVVASNIEPLREVCGSAACFADPLSHESLAEALHKVLTDSDLRQALSKGGLQRAQHFGWEKTARRMLDIFEELHDG